MNNFFSRLSFFVLFLSFFISCKDVSTETSETILTGELNVYVDETISSIIEEQKEIFENQYNAQINITALPESVIVNSMLNDSADVVFLTRDLNNNEKLFFDKKKITGKKTVFGYDAIVLIRNNNSNDTIVSYEDLENVFHQKNNHIKGFVFDNPNSSIIKFFESKFSSKISGNNQCFSLKNQDEVIDFISKNNDYIGFISLNTFLHHNPSQKDKLKNVNELYVKVYDSINKQYISYNSDYKNLANNLYPFRRPLYMLNYQGKTGLGMGFASFLAGNIGQLILDRAGLLPVRIPPREIIVRDKIIKK